MSELVLEIESLEVRYGAVPAVRAAAGDLHVFEVQPDTQGVRSEGWV